MPLDAHEPRAVVDALDGLDHAVRGPGGHLESLGDVAHRLVMDGVDQQGVVTVEASEQRPWRDVNLVLDELVALPVAVVKGAIHLGGEILVEGAPEGRVQDLNPTADAE